MKKKQGLTLKDEWTEFLLYKNPNGDIKIDVLLQNETIWMPQKKIAELFDVQRPAITKHIKNIFDSAELEEDSVSSILEHTASDGKTYKTKYYNLDVITMYLDYAEHQAEKGIAMTMENWVSKLDAFLQFNEEDILQNSVKVTAEIAKSFAESEFEKYKPIQDKLFQSDFDKEIKKMLSKKAEEK